MSPNESAQDFPLHAGLDAVADAAIDVFKGIQRDAEQAEALRSAEHRAFMAEQREMLSDLKRQVEERIASVRDGEDGRDGADGAQGPQGEAGPQGERGLQGEPGPAGKDGADAYPGEARGLFDPEARYRAMDVVSFNGSEWRAKVDNPGELPGEGWMLSASKGKRGDRGERGPDGLQGPIGKAGPALLAGVVDPATMKLTLTDEDGRETTVDLYEFAERVRSVAVA
jgi:hypothetical protein